MQNWDRRQFLTALGSAAAAVTASQRIQLPEVTPFGHLRLRTQTPDDPDWSQAQVLESVDGVLDVELTAASAVWNVGGVAVNTNLYNGNAPGPTLRVRPGDRLRILLRNEMDKTTNLHVHGMHVSPLEPSDYVYMSVASGDEFQYTYDIPADHPPGTYWYHPHRHPHNAQQVGGGMAGMIQVVGSLDELPVVAEAVQRQVFVQGTFVKVGDPIDDKLLPANWFHPVPTPDRELTPPATASGTTQTAGVTDTMPPSTLGYYQVHPVNGTILPRLTAQGGTVERWRIVNASFAMAMVLQIDDHQMHVVAVDGNPLETVQNVDEWVLPPAGRIDVLVVPGEPGTYFLRSRDMSAYNPDPIYLVQADADTSNERLLVEMGVEGEGAQTPRIPAQGARGYFADLREVPVDRQRKVSSTRVDDTWAFGDALWDADRIDHRVSLWAVEEWVFTETAGKMHPIHFHVNPFQVVAINGHTVDQPWWTDVAILPNKGSMTIRMYFRDFEGKYPMHCHNLNHADGGMMQNLQVDDDGAYAPRKDLA
ncbi:MAG: multicopper oxidase family protein [Ornithinimicrobium sp.]